VLSVRHDPLYAVVDHGGGLSTLYGHMSSIDLPNGARVQAGDPIGQTGRSGNVPPHAQPHLHFELRRGGAAQNPLLTPMLDPRGIPPDTP
jgi:murein DD-endopeptidase MepM/ murein hydrolase activator NlpD